MSYHFVVADGTQGGVLGGPFLPAAPASVRSRLDMEVLDVDYANYEPSLGPNWDMKWRVGVRGTIQYNDSQATNGISFQQDTNRYWGIGVIRSLPMPR